MKSQCRFYSSNDQVTTVQTALERRFYGSQLKFKHILDLHVLRDNYQKSTFSTSYLTSKYILSYNTEFIFYKESTQNSVHIYLILTFILQSTGLQLIQK